ncbi:MAG: hypothetical protein LLF94_00215 [Chlamydiales bacterium]|nr:hypothetical protein [Chlamydiales bacterium]
MTSIENRGIGPTDPFPNENKENAVPQVRVPAAQKNTDNATRLVKKAVESVELAKVKAVPYISEEVLRDKLMPGDIFLSYYPESTDAVAGVISLGEKLAKQVYVKGNKDSHNFVHAALYLGDGRIAEAVSDGVRINELSGDRFKLKPGMKHGFLVIRPENAKLGAEAARIADELSAQSPEEKTKHEYSIMQALGAVVSHGKLEKQGIKRYLMGACYQANNLQPTNKNGIRSFFCSYFVGWAFQVGEATSVVKKLNIEFPTIDKRLSHAEQGKAISKWATEVTNKHYKALQGAIHLQFDPKYSTPQHLYLYCLSHPELFSQEMLIVAPKQEMEMDTYNKN